jgi:hypothetical protein
VVLSMDATNPTFLVRCESNPALYTRCDIVWMGEWRRASMRVRRAVVVVVMVMVAMMMIMVVGAYRGADQMVAMLMLVSYS